MSENTEVSVVGIYQYLSEVLGVKEVLEASEGTVAKQPSQQAERPSQADGQQAVMAAPSFLYLHGEGLTSAKCEFWVVTDKNEFTLEEQELVLKMTAATKVDDNELQVLWTPTEYFGALLKEKVRAPFVVILSDDFKATAELSKHIINNVGSRKILWTHGPESIGKNQEIKKRTWSDLQKIMKLWSA